MEPGPCDVSVYPPCRSPALRDFSLVSPEPGKALTGCLGALHCPAGGGTVVILWKANLTYRITRQSPQP